MMRQFHSTELLITKHGQRQNGPSLMSVEILHKAQLKSSRKIEKALKSGQKRFKIMKIKKLTLEQKL